MFVRDASTLLLFLFLSKDKLHCLSGLLRLFVVEKIRAIIYSPRLYQTRLTLVEMNVSPFV